MLNPFQDPVGYFAGTVVTVGYQVGAGYTGKYVFDHWVLDGVNRSEETFQITMGTADVTLVLVMKEVVVPPQPFPWGILAAFGVVIVVVAVVAVATK